MGRFGRGLAGFAVGLVAGAGIALGLCVAAAYAFEISQFEGAYAMGVAFFWMPLGGIIGGILGAIWLLRRP